MLYIFVYYCNLYVAILVILLIVAGVYVAVTQPCTCPPLETSADVWTIRNVTMSPSPSIQSIVNHVGPVHLYIIQRYR